LAVLAFNWVFVPPRGTLRIEVQQHAWMLVATLVVGWLVATLVAKQRSLAEDAQRAATQTLQLRQMGDALRDADDPLSRAHDLQRALEALSAAPASLLLLREALPKQDDDEAAVLFGTPDEDERAGLWLCTRQAAPLGPGTGRHQDQPDWFLPLRARGSAYGAAQLVAPEEDRVDSTELRAHAQAMCDQMGMALERTQDRRAATLARERYQTQQVRNALLTAIAHDYRTPLATILSAASSLQAQEARLSDVQRLRLAATIVDEAERLNSLTDNTLQLARLDAPGASLKLDWQSAEELVGSAVARARRQDPQRRIRTRLDPELPLVRCDAVLMVQMLVNLLDNALKHAPPDTPVEMLVRRVGEELMFAVRDRGPGVVPELRERIFEVFQRGTSESPGAGVGLALAKAVARVHRGRLLLRPRHHGGSSFECFLPIDGAPTETPSAESSR
ncbi:MAG: ATP-binding protein, partial [Pseudomonadota bacterium]